MLEIHLSSSTYFSQVPKQEMILKICQLRLIHTPASSWDGLLTAFPFSGTTQTEHGDSQIAVPTAQSCRQWVLVGPAVNTRADQTPELGQAERLN